MISLIASEWGRLWSRKITWLLFAILPILLLITGNHYLGENDGITPGNPGFTAWDSFPVMALSNQLMTVFNMILLLLFVFSITEEYRTGQLRMVMIRSYSFSQLLIAKWITVMGIMLLFHGLYFLLSYVVGGLFFDSSPHLFFPYYQDPIGGGPALTYTIRYFALAFLTLVAVSWLITFFAVISQSTTTAIGITLGFLLISFGYPQILQTFTKGLNPPLDAKWYFLSLTQIQTEGIALALGQTSKFLTFNGGVLFVYAFAFGTAAYLFFTKKDRFI
ncbi:ABC transporter permease [Marininema halotolerans]|uniref:ABC-2 family transporter protein n=1 Tax=Marininema halotolerans TaxID=1155944 RepID=A0A1I6UGS7_9BACL|nr:ABC transporter permease [Marininema halotolerans]SFT00611.1 ABC-2 family transporter protein [Marininema halotolerans]